MRKPLDFNVLLHEVRGTPYGWACSCGEWGIFRKTAYMHVLSHLTDRD